MPSQSPFCFFFSSSVTAVAFAASKPAAPRTRVSASVQVREPSCCALRDRPEQRDALSEVGTRKPWRGASSVRSSRKAAALCARRERLYDARLPLAAPCNSAAARLVQGVTASGPRRSPFPFPARLRPFGGCPVSRPQPVERDRLQPGRSKTLAPRLHRSIGFGATCNRTSAAAGQYTGNTSYEIVPASHPKVPITFNPPTARVRNPCPYPVLGRRTPRAKTARRLALLGRPAGRVQALTSSLRVARNTPQGLVF